MTAYKTNKPTPLQRLWLLQRPLWDHNLLSMHLPGTFQLTPQHLKLRSPEHIYSITAAWFALSAWEQTPGFNRLGPAT